MKTTLQAFALALLLSLDCQAQTSPDNTRVPPSPSITIFTNPTIWSLGAPSVEFPGNFDVLRNGVSVLGARASKIAWCNGSIYVFGRNQLWWRFTGSWLATGLATIPCDTSKNFSLSWDYGPIDSSGSNTPTIGNIYRNNTKVASVNYPTAAYKDPTATKPGETTCYQVSAENTTGESPKSVQVCSTP